MWLRLPIIIEEGDNDLYGLPGTPKTRAVNVRADVIFSLYETVDKNGNLVTMMNAGPMKYKVYVPLAKVQNALGMKPVDLVPLANDDWKFLKLEETE